MRCYVPFASSELYKLLLELPSRVDTISCIAADAAPAHRLVILISARINHQRAVFIVRKVYATVSQIQRRRAASQRTRDSRRKEPSQPCARGAKHAPRRALHTRRTPTRVFFQPKLADRRQLAGLALLSSSRGQCGGGAWRCRGRAPRPTR